MIPYLAQNMPMSKTIPIEETVCMIMTTPLEELILKNDVFGGKWSAKLKLITNKNYYFKAYLIYINKTSTNNPTNYVSLCFYYYKEN